MKTSRSEHHRQRSKWYLLALQSGAAVAALIGLVWWPMSCFALLGDRMLDGNTAAHPILEMMVQPSFLLLLTGLSVLWVIGELDRRPPKNPAPGELWRWRVNHAIGILRHKLGAARRTLLRAPATALQKQLEDELTLRLNRLTWRYFPPAPGRPPRRYRKLSEY